MRGIAKQRSREGDGGWLGGLVQHQRRREAKHRPRLFGLRGDLVNLALTALAAVAGLIVFGAWCVALSGRSVPMWWGDKDVHRGSDLVDVPTGATHGEAEMEATPRAGAVPVRVVEPTISSTLMALFGSLVAAAGLVRAHRSRSSLPMLCVIGIVLCWIPLLASQLETMLLALT